MTNSETLTKAIQKAIDGGWRADWLKPDHDQTWRVINWLDLPYDLENYYKLIFNHNFAKALWGNGPNCAYCGLPPHYVHPSPCPEGNNIWPYLWEYHLQNMVTSEDPIKYLGENL